MKKRLTFFNKQGDTFLRDIIIDLRKDYEIKYFSGDDAKEFFSLLHYTDIAWFEWCDDLIVAATRHPKTCKIICRLHSYEMFTPLPHNVDWNKVDSLMFVNPVVRKYCIEKFGIRPDITTVINNGVNTKRFSIPENKTYNKKVAFIGNINYKKGPQFLLQVFNSIYQYDNNFEFYIAGKPQDERIHFYMQNIQQHLPYKLHFDGWQENVSEYLKDKDYVISTSLFESFQYSLAEGMLQGCIPLIHTWPSSEFLYPKEFLFYSPEDAVNIVRSFDNLNDQDAMRNKVRDFITENYSTEKQMKEIRSLLKSME